MLPITSRMPWKHAEARELLPNGIRQFNIFVDQLCLLFIGHNPLSTLLQICYEYRNDEKRTSNAEKNIHRKKAVVLKTTRRALYECIFEIYMQTHFGSQSLSTVQYILSTVFVCKLKTATYCLIISTTGGVWSGFLHHMLGKDLAKD